MLSSRCALLAAFITGSTFAATLGTVVPITGGAADLVLDQTRGLVYLVDTNLNEIQIYSISKKTLLNPIPTDSTPLAAALSPDGNSLYVTCNGATALDVINLNTTTQSGRVSLPAKPEGVAAGADGRVLISTSGSGTGDTQNILLIYNPADGSVKNVIVTPGAPESPLLPPTASGPALYSRSQLRATADGSLIIGVNIVNGTTSTGTQSVFVYETASAVVLRSRRVANISNVLAVAPDNSKFMAGLTLFDTTTLGVIAQNNLANAQYPISTATTANFNTQANQGGSIFSPDGTVLYSAFNIAPTANPATLANVSQFLYNDPTNLLITQALQLPENLAGKMEISSDGGTVYALSESGFTLIPLSQLSSNPIAAVDSPVNLLASDQCGVVANMNSATVNITNAGKGKMTATASLIAATTGPTALGGGGGGGGGGFTIIVGGGGPGGTAIGGNTGTNTTGSNTATAPTVKTTQTGSGAQFQFTFNNTLKDSIGTASPFHDFLIQSPEAVNLPPRVRIYQNSRNAEAAGTIIPILVGDSTTGALQELAYDSINQRIYIANAGLNRIEVYDIQQGQLLTPIKVGQLPQSIALTPDGGTMYVANSGGESISIIDVPSLKVIGTVAFPATPFDASVTLVTPSVIAATERGAIFLMSNGSIWNIIGNQALPRPASSIIGTTTTGAQTALTTPYTLAATPAGEFVIVTNGNGYVYLYDALVDEFVQARQIQTTPITGYRNPVTAGPKGQYYVVNGILMNSALTPIAGVPTVTSQTNSTTTTTNVPIAAVIQVSATQYARFTQPVRTSTNQTLTTAPTVDIIDATTGATRNSFNALEGPLSQVASATASTTIPGRTMAVDSTGTNAYLLTTSGLSIVPLSSASASSRPVLNQRAAVNLGSQTTTIAPNSLAAISGKNLADSASAPTSGDLPTILGGVCVTLGNTPIPLLMTSATQINAQIPPQLATGSDELTVRSIENHVATASQSMTLSKYAPAVLFDANGNVELYQASNNHLISKSNPANRDEPLIMYVTGLGVPSGAAVSAGVPVQASPAISTAAVNVYFGNPLWSQAGVIVNGSHFAPGMIGVYVLDLVVPGTHISGNDLVTIKIGGVSSPSTGSAVPMVWVN